LTQASQAGQSIWHLFPFSVIDFQSIDFARTVALEIEQQCLIRSPIKYSIHAIRQSPKDQRKDTMLTPRCAAPTTGG
jgi:hypothetical protein